MHPALNMVQKEVSYRPGLIQGAFMGCERISVCLGRKLFDPQKSKTTSSVMKNKWKKQMKNLIIQELKKELNGSNLAFLVLYLRKLKVCIETENEEKLLPNLLPH